MPRLGHKKSVTITPPLLVVIYTPVISSRGIPVQYAKLITRSSLTQLLLLDQDWAVDNVKPAMSR
jgi:hypothetical protein